MNGNGAYPEEMDFSHPEIATFARRCRRRWSASRTRSPPRHGAPPRRGSARLGRDRVGARPAPAPPSLQPAPQLVAPAPGAVALAVAMLPLLTAGLAVAGVRLPAVAENAFEAVGVELPNQGARAPPTIPRTPTRAPATTASPRPPRRPSPAPRRRSRATAAGQRPAEPQQRRWPGTGPEPGQPGFRRQGEGQARGAPGPDQAEAGSRRRQRRGDGRGATRRSGQAKKPVSAGDSAGRRAGPGSGQADGLTATCSDR